MFEKAKEIVNEIYQPLGYLNCGVSNSKMWEYAKNQAEKFAKKMIDELSDLPRIPYNERRQKYWEELLENIKKQ